MYLRVSECVQNVALCRNSALKFPISPLKDTRCTVDLGLLPAIEYRNTRPASGLQVWERFCNAHGYIKKKKRPRILSSNLSQIIDNG